VVILDHLQHRDVPDEVRDAVAADAVGALVCDASRIFDANDHLLRLLGFSRAQLEAGELSWLRMTTPEWLADDARAIGALRATGRADAYEKEFFSGDRRRVRVRLADVLLGLDPLRIFALVGAPSDPAGRQAIDALDAASRAWAGAPPGA
jgi:PAS domain-containing protein